MLGRTDSRPRLILLFLFLGVFAGALGLRLAYWQIGQGDMLRSEAEQQLAGQGSEAQPPRGEIVDRDGTVLATTAYRDLLAAYPDLMSSEDRPKIARKLGEILGLSTTQVDALVASFDQAPQYAIVARRLTTDQSDQVRDGMRFWIVGVLAALLGVTFFFSTYVPAP